MDVSGAAHPRPSNRHRGWSQQSCGYVCCSPDHHAGKILAWTIATLITDHLNRVALQLWTLSHPFAHIRRDSAVVIMLQGLIDRNIESIDRPDKVPVAVWACLEDCLNVNPAVRPSAGTLLSRLERMLMNGSAD